MSDATPPTPSYAPAPASGRTNVLAIVALILGIVVPLGGVIVGPIALSQIKRTGEGGRGLAIAGIIIGAVLILLYIILIIVSVVLAAASASLSTY
jgi:peptidyl-prolyl cis-trans isomerase B (cyclophilin B)